MKIKINQNIIKNMKAQLLKYQEKYLNMIAVSCIHEKILIITLFGVIKIFLTV
jgi:hypothetical protein